MKIIVRKLPEMILDKSFEQIEGLYETCTGKDAMDAFYNSLVRCQYDDSLNLEDDIVLCKDFLNEINKVIEKNPNKLITFFTLKKMEDTKKMPGRTFCMAQCFYIPQWLNKLLINYYPKWVVSERGIKHPDGLDLMVADFLALIKEDYILSYPCLVQHMEMKSRIDPRRSSKRQTKYFKDDLEKGE